jgi:hypothetical protein
MTLVRTLVAAALAFALAGCSDTPDEPAEQAMTPPATFTERSVGPVRVFAPEDWQPVGEIGATDDSRTELALRADAAPGASAPVLLAVLERDPARGAAAEADSLIRIKRDVQQAGSVQTEEQSLAGFASSVVVSYRETLVSGEEQLTEVLVADLPDGSLFTATVKASPTVFREAGLVAVTRTATATATSASTSPS